MKNALDCLEDSVVLYKEHLGILPLTHQAIGTLVESLHNASFLWSLHRSLLSPTRFLRVIKWHSLECSAQQLSKALLWPFEFPVFCICSGSLEPMMTLKKIDRKIVTINF